MSTERPTPQFIRVEPLDQNNIQGLYTKDITQYLKVTKLTIQRYLEECLRPDGQFRKFFDRFASFTVGFDINESFSEDLDKRHLQIARFFEDMKERPPQMFIQDGGYQYVPASLGGLTEGWNLRDSKGSQVVRVCDVVTIPIKIYCAAISEQEVEDLEAIASAALGQFQRFTCGYILRPEFNPEHGAYWEVRLPKTHQLGEKSHAPLHEDPRMQIWQAPCTMDVVFENSTYIQYKADPQAIPSNLTSSLVVPSTIRLGQDTPVTILNQPPRCMMYSNDARVAIVEKKNFVTFVLRPRRPGTFKLIVSAEDGDSDSGPRIILSQDITVVAR